MPAQYEPERIGRNDIQSLLRRVTVVPNPEYSKRFPDEHCCRITVTLTDGRFFTKEKVDYDGFHTRPMSWGRVTEKFEGLAEEVFESSRRREIVDAVKRLDGIAVKDLMALLG
jgi:2-methylcitrate dehydratase